MADAGEVPPLKRARTSGAPSAARNVMFTALYAAYSEDMGSRTSMEDVAVILLEGSPAATTTTAPASTVPASDASAQQPAAPACRVAFIGVFDGHGGRKVAEYAGEHLHANVLAAGLAAEARRVGELVAGAACTSGNAGVDPATSADTTQPSQQEDQQQKALLPSVKACKAAIVEGFKATDTAILERCSAEAWPDGCCLVAAWVVGQLVLVANVGDSRGVLARRQPSSANTVPAAALPPPGSDASAGGNSAVPLLKAITLTRDHKAIHAAERQRIEKAGSFVSADGRLAGRIEVSRALGDRQFKRSGMSATPDIQAFQIGERDDFLLLGCDGFWSVFPPQEAADFAARELYGRGNDVKQTCNRLLYSAVRERGCKDNCTVLLLRFERPARS